jgi:hypothetical protein
MTTNVRGRAPDPLTRLRPILPIEEGAHAMAIPTGGLDGPHPPKLTIETFKPVTLMSTSAPGMGKQGGRRGDDARDISVP